MFLIRITGDVIGKALLYERPKRQGDRRMVPTYAAYIVSAEVAPLYQFAVTRDASPQIFGERDNRYGHLGECPPSPVGRPYRGRVREDAQAGYSVQLYSENDPLQEEINGPEGVRKHIMLHFGPAASEGCLLVAGGKRAFGTFRRKMQELAQSNDTHIYVEVLPRAL